MFRGLSAGAKRSVDHTPRDFLAAWGRGDAGPVCCGACTACCYYPGIAVDEKRDRKRSAHLLTERSPDGELVLQRRSDGACVHLGERGCTVYQPAARCLPYLRLPRSPRWALSSAAGRTTKRRVGSSPGVSERTRRYGAETPVLDWRERLVCSRYGSRRSMVVTGTKRR